MSKINSTCYLFRNLREVLTIPQMLSLYHAYVESRLRYAIVFWGLSTMSRDVFICQKRVLRCLAGVDDTVSCRNLFRGFKVLTLAGLLIMEVTVKIFHKRTGLLVGADIHSYNTRQRNLLRVPYSRLTVSQRSPENVGIRIFNVLPVHIKEKSDLLAFKRALKAFLIDNCFYTIEEFFRLCE